MCRFEYIIISKPKSLNFQPHRQPYLTLRFDLVTVDDSSKFGSNLF